MRKQHQAGHKVFLILILSVFLFPIMSGSRIYTYQEKDPNQVFDPALFQGMHYRMIGPHRGGRVTAVAGHADQPATFYMGGTGGGVWKTTDYGQSWKSISDKYFKVGSIGAIDVADSNPKIIYVGTAAMYPPDAGFTSRPTPAKPGLLSACVMQARSVRS